MEIRLARPGALARVQALSTDSRPPASGLEQHLAETGQGFSQRLGFRQAGYTLIELAIAVVVFAILLSLATVRLQPVLLRTRVNRAATVVATDLQYAQLLAVQQRRPVALIVDPVLKGYLIRLRDSAVTFRDRFLGSDTDFRLDSLSAAPATVILYPNGVASAAVTVSLGAQGYVRRVRMTRGGQVRMVP